MVWYGMLVVVVVVVNIIIIIIIIIVVVTTTASILSVVADTKLRHHLTDQALSSTPTAQSVMEAMCIPSEVARAHCRKDRLCSSVPIKEKGKKTEEDVFPICGAIV